MDRQHVISILESLANGLDPATGARIPIDAFHTPDSIRALFTAHALLKEEATPRRGRNGQQLVAAGAAWDADEEARLCTELDSGLSIAQIALEHGRSSGAITSRLVKLGRIDPTSVKTRERGAQVA